MFYAARTRSLLFYYQVSLALVGAVGGPLCGMFLLGGIFRFIEWKVSKYRKLFDYNQSNYVSLQRNSYLTQSILQGVSSGGLVSLALNIWISIGSISVKGQHPILPPAPVDQCDPPFNLTESQPAAPL